MRSGERRWRHAFGWCRREKKSNPAPLFSYGSSVPKYNGGMSVPNTATCLGCGYSLRGLTESRCPECGKGFDSNDPTSYCIVAKQPLWQRWAKPPTWLHVLCVTVYTLVMLLDLSHAGGLYFTLSLMMMSVCCCIPSPILLVVADYAAHVGALHYARQENVPVVEVDNTRRKLRWAVTPTCVVLLLLALGTEWPMRLRFRLSKPAFEGAVRRHVESDGEFDVSQWVGLYFVESIEPCGPNLICLETERRGTATGFIHVQEPPSPKVTVELRSRLSKNWYTYKE